MLEKNPPLLGRTQLQLAEPLSAFTSINTAVVLTSVYTSFFVSGHSCKFKCGPGNRVLRILALFVIMFSMTCIIPTCLFEAFSDSGNYIDEIIWHLHFAYFSHTVIIGFLVLVMAFIWHGWKKRCCFADNDNLQHEFAVTTKGMSMIGTILATAFIMIANILKKASMTMTIITTYLRLSQTMI